MRVNEHLKLTERYTLFFIRMLYCIVSIDLFQKIIRSIFKILVAQTKSFVVLFVDYHLQHALISFK